MAALFPADAEARRVVAQQSRYVHQQVPASLIGGVIILVFFIAVFWSRIPLSQLHAWSAAVLAIIGASLMLAGSMIVGRRSGRTAIR